MRSCYVIFGVLIVVLIKLHYEKVDRICSQILHRRQSNKS